MKKLITLLVVLSTFITYAFSQKITTIGSFGALEGQQRVKMYIDFSEADIMGMEEDDFAAYEENYVRYKVEIVANFYSYANEALRGKLLVGNYKQETEYTLNVIVHSVSAKGDYSCDLILSHDNGDIAKAEGIFCKGGKFGSKLNLMKDGAEHTGAFIGFFLKKQIEKAEKEKKIRR